MSYTPYANFYLHKAVEEGTVINKTSLLYFERVNGNAYIFFPQSSTIDPNKILEAGIKNLVEENQELNEEIPIALIPMNDIMLKEHINNRITH